MNEQGSEAWLADRMGLCTASCFADVLAKGQGLTRKKYMLKLVTERLTGKYLETYSNAHMDRGNEQEPHARIAYEMLTGNIVEETGFIRHSILKAGGSPDGLIDSDGLIEIKSVIPTVQIETIEKGGYPSGHKAQIQGCLWVSGRDWCDFISYSPDLPENLSLYTHRVVRDDEYIANLEVEIVRFLDELEVMYNRLLEFKRK